MKQKTYEIFEQIGTWASLLYICIVLGYFFWLFMAKSLGMI
tara:strand:+ start:108 stop:230 length:123 start_codon:yes stop_codon:yes gene_type:complete